MAVDGREASTVDAQARLSVPLSFDEFYAAEYSAVVRVAFVLTGRLNVAEELAQEAFLAAFRRWDSIARYERPDAWLRRVVVNRSVSAWRRATTEARLVARLSRERAREPAFDAPDDEVWEAVRSLPIRQRQVVALVTIDDLSVAAIAEILGCTEDSVRTHLRRARQRLAELLGETENHDES